MICARIDDEAAVEHPQRPESRRIDESCIASIHDQIKRMKYIYDTTLTSLTRRPSGTNKKICAFVLSSLDGECTQVEPMRDVASPPHEFSSCICKEYFKGVAYVTIWKRER